MEGLLNALHGRGYLALIVLIALPFLTPIPLPISPLLGLIIAAIGLRLGFGQKPWLPRRVLTAQLPQKFVPTVLMGAARILGIIEKLSKPRMSLLSSSLIMFRFNALMIALAGVLLMLPFPPIVLFTNALPAYTIIFLAFGAMERDGLCTLIGHALLIVTLAYFGLILFGGVHLLHLIWDRIHEGMRGS
jgi:hypothetical protein